MPMDVLRVSHILLPLPINDAYNMQLSERRAKSTLEWLVHKGIDRSRLSSKGYGESQLINNCSNGVYCSEDDHQLNRRSMFIIQE